MDTCGKCGSDHVVDGYCLDCRRRRMSSDDCVAWMRRVGAVQAKWTPEGILTECVLGPEPESPMAPPPERPASTDDKKPNHEEELLFGAA